MILHLRTTAIPMWMLAAYLLLIFSCHSHPYIPWAFDPGILETDPSDGSIGVVLRPTISVAFSKELDPSSLNDVTFTVHDGVATIPGTVAYAGTTGTFQPASSLKFLTGHAVTLSAGIQDLAGLTLASDYRWSFQTRDLAWIAPTTLSGPLDAPSDPAVAFSAAGNGLAVWGEYDGLEDRWNLMASRFDPESGWSVPESIEDSTSNTNNPLVAMDDYGDAIVLWEEYVSATPKDLWTRRFSTSSGWGTPELLETENTYTATGTSIASNPNGDAIATWAQFDGTQYRCWARRYIPGSGWDTPQIIQTDPGSAQSCGVILDRAGNGFAFWRSSNRLWARRFEASAGWGASQRLDDDGGNVYWPRLAVDLSGKVMAIWVQSDGVPNYVWANYFAPGSGWSTPQRVDPEIVNVGAQPDVAFDPGGDAIAVWMRSNGTRDRIRSCRFRPGFGWSASELLDSENGGNGRSPRILVDSFGNSVTVWSDFDPTGEPPIWSNRSIAGSGWGEARVITSGATAGGAPAVAIHPDGQAIGVWYEKSNGTLYEVRASQFR